MADHTPRHVLERSRRDYAAELHRLTEAHQSEIAALKTAARRRTLADTAAADSRKLIGRLEAEIAALREARSAAGPGK